MVILSTILPTSINRAHALHILAPKHLIQFSFSLSLTFGILLLILSGDILRNKTFLLYDDCFFNWSGYFNTLKGIDVEETFILLIVLAVLYMLRKRFVREKMEVSLSDIVKVFIFLLVTLYLYKNLGILFAGAKEAFKPDFVVRNITQVKRSALAVCLFVPTFY